MSLTPIQWGLIALFAPLVSAILIGLYAPLRRAGRPAAVVSILGASLSLVAALALFADQLGHEGAVVVELVRWLPGAGESVVDVGLRLDGVSLSMLLVVTVVATCVQVFSLGYMADEPPPDFGRYFGYHSLFIFAMNLLVVAPNMLQLFAGWELVGLTSYLLIGYYWRKPSAARAAVKAFWVTKLGDVGLLIGIIILYAYTGSFSFGWEVTLAGAAPLVTGLLFLGVMGKSAQFPLHVWLPDAMEGPTPVSALLHAATMVAAGVFLLVRAEPLFVQAPATQELMAYVGAFTALFAAVIAVVQTDIKKVLAYSTCSQLGYMVCALGAGSAAAGFFHLTTHAAFKALLFLAAGSVIHAVHTNDIREMGGLARRMKLTTTVFVIGALALAGVPGLSGFFSKDLVLEAVLERGLWLPLAALLVGVFLTAFYMGRVICIAFLGEPSERAEHAREGGASMGLPLVVLAALALGAGWFGSDLATLWGAEIHFHLSPIGIAATALGLAGIGLSYLVYQTRQVPASAFSALEPIARVARSGFVDRLWLSGYENFLLRLSATVAWIDRYLVDGMVNLAGYLTIHAGRRLRKLQTGNVQHYVYAVIAGAIVLVTWGLWR